MQKHTIHIVSKYFYPVAAGIETNILQTYKVLIEKGWNVTIHTSKDTLTAQNVLDDMEMIEGITVKRYPFRYYSYLPKFSARKGDIVAMHNFNIIPHLYIMVYTMVLKLLNKKQYALILTPHGGFNPEWRIFPKHVAFIKKIYHFTIGVLCINLSVDAVRAVSVWEKNEMINKGINPDKVHVISNGVEDEAFTDVDALAGQQIRENVHGYGRYILQIGRIYMIKNYETTLHALTKAPRDVQYIIAGPVGDLAYEKSLKDLCKKLGIENRVHLVGVIRGIDKFYLIKHAQMMVHMAMWESFCNVVHEAMSQGLVCIVADNTALPLLIKNDINGYCLPTMDSNAVAEKINYVLDHKNDKEIRLMEQNNYTFGRQESWSQVASKMDTLYTQLSAEYI